MFDGKIGSEGEMSQYTEESMDRNEAAIFFQHLAGQQQWQSQSWLEGIYYRIVAPLFGFGDDLISVLAANIKGRKTKWLWNYRIPLGKLTLFVGNPDNGKSMVATDVTARVTKGLGWPDDEKNILPASDVLIFADEDDHEDTSVPRLMASGADLKRVRFGEMHCEKSGPLPVERQMRIDQDIVAIEKHLDENPNIKLIVLDPVSNHLGSVNMNEEQSVRNVLTPLQQLAAPAP